MLVEDLPAGAVVSEYRIERLIGEGSFGKVYAAVHPVIGKFAAVKVLSVEYAHKPQFVSRFVEEARAVNLIRHRNIVDIFGFGSLPDGRPYFVMELLEGLPLGDYLKQRGRMPIGEAIPVLRKVARALGAAHAAGIAHRDLKPDNVFLTFDEDGICFPKLLDFGIAKLMGSSAAGHRTATGTPMGTPLYMSPEQCKGENVDHRTDIYAFGMVVHEVLTGRLPFDVKNVAEIMVAHLSQQPSPMSSAAPDLPPALDGPVLQMLAKDPQDRPQQIVAGLEALAEAARQAGLAVPSAVPSDLSGHLAAPPAGSPEAATGPTVPVTGSMVDGLPGGYPNQPSPGQSALPATQPSAGQGGAIVATAAPGAYGAGYYPNVGTAAKAYPARRRGGWPTWLTWVLIGGGLLLFIALALIVVSAAMMAKSKGRRSSAGSVLEQPLELDMAAYHDAQDSCAGWRRVGRSGRPGDELSVAIDSRPDPQRLTFVEACGRCFPGSVVQVASELGGVLRQLGALPVHQAIEGRLERLVAPVAVGEVAVETDVAGAELVAEVTDLGHRGPLGPHVGGITEHVA